MNYQPAKLFTIEEANACLPLVRAIAKDLSALSHEVIERRERLSLIRKNRTEGLGEEPDPSDPYTSELEQIKQELEKDGVRLQEYVLELQDLGVEPKNGLEGLVDFPSEMDGRIVYLCWKLDEPEVLFWHELEAGFRGRQSLTADSVLGDDLLG